jgi:hypothetical protein
MKSEDYQELFARDFTNRQRELCALVVSLLLCVFWFFQDGSLFAGRLSVGTFSFAATAAILLAISLASACVREPSRSLAVAANIVRAMPAANVPGPKHSSSERQFNCHSNVAIVGAAVVLPPQRVQGQTGSTPVWGNGQTSCASITEFRFTAWTLSSNSRSR